MVDFVCPECGSIDHVDADSVRYPHQCPGCELLIQAPAPPHAPDHDDRINPVRVRLLPTDQWRAPSSRLALEPASRQRRRRFSWGYVVFPALLVPVLVVAAYVWVNNPVVRDEDPRPQHQIASQAAPPLPGPEAPLPSRAAHPLAREAGHVGRGAQQATAISDPDTEEQTRQEAGAQPTAEAAATEPPASQPETTASQSAEAHLPEPTTTPAPLGLHQAPTPLRGVTTAKPLYPGVPVVTEPSWQARRVVATAAGDTLLILDRRAHNDWLHVIHVGSGREGWVRLSQVRITFSGQ